MLRLLHFSDPHGNQKVMSAMDRLARDLCDYDVVACTGDCLGPNHRETPESWNLWPQPFKLLVPGNHDEPGTFIRLQHWRTKTPWHEVVGGVSFIGLDTA